MWQQHCERLCATLQVPFESTTINVREELNGREGGIEAAARSLRYQSFEKQLQAGEILLLAHHADDQFETLLLRLMRGSGLQGLASIPRRRKLGRGELLRPMLTVSREEIEEYARKVELNWVEDESNADTRFDRNYCRHSVLPLLANRWPEYRASLSKSMQLLQEASTLNDELAQIDLFGAATPETGVLECGSMQALSTPRLRNLMRFWLQGFGLSDTSWNVLSVLAAGIQQSQGSESKTLIETKEYCIGLFANRLHLYPPLKTPIEPQGDWCFEEGDFNLAGNGVLQLLNGSNSHSESIDRGKIKQLTVKYRQGGEKITLPGRPRKSLKKLFQEYGIPTWRRSCVPLLYNSDELICVPGIGVSHAYASNLANAEAQSICWTPANFNWLNKDESN